MGMKRSVQLEKSSADTIHIGDTPAPAPPTETQDLKDTRVVFSLSLALAAVVTILIGVLMVGGALLFFLPRGGGQGQDVIGMLERIKDNIDDISSDLSKNQRAIESLTKDVVENQNHTDEERAGLAKIIAAFDRDLADIRAELRMTQRELGAGVRVDEPNETKPRKENE